MKKTNKGILQRSVLCAIALFFYTAQGMELVDECVFSDLKKAVYENNLDFLAQNFKSFQSLSDTQKNNLFFLALAPARNEKENKNRGYLINLLINMGVPYTRKNIQQQLEIFRSYGYSNRCVEIPAHLLKKGILYFSSRAAYVSILDYYKNDLLDAIYVRDASRIERLLPLKCKIGDSPEFDLYPQEFLNEPYEYATVWEMAQEILQHWLLLY